MNKIISDISSAPSQNLSLLCDLHDVTRFLKLPRELLLLPRHLQVYFPFINKWINKWINIASLVKGRPGFSRQLAQLTKLDTWFFELVPKPWDPRCLRLVWLSATVPQRQLRQLDPDPPLLMRHSLWHSEVIKNKSLISSSPFSSFAEILWKGDLRVAWEEQACLCLPGELWVRKGGDSGWLGITTQVFVLSS